MTFQLAAILPQLLPRVIDWAEARSKEVLSTGVPLQESGLRLARAVGVVKPELIRVCTVPIMPLPVDQELRNMALKTGLLGPDMTGLTLGYGIYICDGHATNRLISHECRHVYQYEIAGSIGDFLPEYFEQVATFGYHDSPLEVDARHHERDNA